MNWEVSWEWSFVSRSTNTGKPLNKQQKRKITLYRTNSNKSCLKKRALKASPILGYTDTKERQWWHLAKKTSIDSKNYDVKTDQAFLYSHRMFVKISINILYNGTSYILKCF